MKMKYGKYKGQEVSDIPIDYLQWVHANVDDFEVQEMVDTELKYRYEHGDLDLALNNDYNYTDED